MSEVERRARSGAAESLRAGGHERQSLRLRDEEARARGDAPLLLDGVDVLAEVLLHELEVLLEVDAAAQERADDVLCDAACELLVRLGGAQVGVARLLEDLLPALGAGAAERHGGIVSAGRGGRRGGRGRERDEEGRLGERGGDRGGGRVRELLEGEGVRVVGLCDACEESGDT